MVFTELKKNVISGQREFSVVFLKHQKHNLLDLLSVGLRFKHSGWKKNGLEKKRTKNISRCGTFFPVMQR